MRYLGNKESIMPEINKLLYEKGLIGKKYKLFDAFCGSGAVSDNLKDKFDLIINDNLKWSVIYTKGRIVAPKCTFDKLGFDPFEFLNSNKKIEKTIFSDINNINKRKIHNEWRDYVLNCNIM